MQQSVLKSGGEVRQVVKDSLPTSNVFTLRLALTLNQITHNLFLHVIVTMSKVKKWNGPRGFTSSLPESGDPAPTHKRVPDTRCTGHLVFSIINFNK